MSENNNLVIPLPTFEEFKKWYYDTKAMDVGGEEAYTVAKTLVPELYEILKSKAVSI